MPRIIHVGTKRPMARKHSSTGGVTYPTSPKDAARRRAEDRRYEAAKTKYLVKQRAAENASARQDAARTAAMREKGTTDRAKIAARSALASAYVQSGRTPPTGTMSTGGDSQQNKAMQAIAKRKRVGERALKYESALKQRGGINPKRSTGAKLRPVSSFAFNAPVADVERVAQQHGITELPVDARFDTANQRALRLKIYGMSRAAQNRQVATSFRQDAEARFPAIQQGQGLGSGVSPATTQAINQNIGGASADLDMARRFATPTEPGYQLTGVDDRIAAAWDQLGQAGPLHSQDYTQLANVARRSLGAVQQPTQQTPVAGGQYPQGQPIPGAQTGAMPAVNAASVMSGLPAAVAPAAAVAPTIPSPIAVPVEARVTAPIPVPEATMAPPPVPSFGMGQGGVMNVAPQPGTFEWANAQRRMAPIPGATTTGAISPEMMASVTSTIPGALPPGTTVGVADQARRRAPLPVSTPSPANTGAAPTMSPEEANAVARRLLPTAAANADIQVPTSQSTAGTGGVLTPTPMEAANIALTKAKTKAIASATEDPAASLEKAKAMEELNVRNARPQISQVNSILGPAQEREFDLYTAELQEYANRLKAAVGTFTPEQKSAISAVHSAPDNPAVRSLDAQINSLTNRIPKLYSRDRQKDLNKRLILLRQIRSTLLGG